MNARSLIRRCFLPFVALVAALPVQAASVFFSQPSYVGFSAEAEVRVDDVDLNTDPATVQSLVVQILSNTDTDGIQLTLFEDGVNSSLFISNALRFSLDFSSSDEDIIQVRHGDTVAALYQDFSPFESLVDTTVWYEFQPGQPSPTRTRTPTSLPTETPQPTSTPTPTELPLFTPVPRPTPILPRILLVDDDGSPVFPDTRPFYTAALQTAGLPFTEATGASLTRSVLDQTDVVVWFNGGAFIDTLTLRERELLAYFLEEKRGKLLFSSQDYLYEETGDLDGNLSSSSFGSRYLSIESVDNDVHGPTVFRGIAGAQTDGQELTLDPNGPLIIDADTITVRAQRYVEDLDENTVAVIDPRENDFRIAFFAFPLESIFPGPGNNNMSALLRRTICAGLSECGDPKAAGRLFFNKEVYFSEQDQAVLTLFDANLNTNPETIQLAVIGSGSTFGGANFILTETGPNTGIFDSITTGKNMRFSKTINDPDRGIIKVFDGDGVSIGYNDASPGGGSGQRVLWFERQPPSPTPTRTGTPTGGVDPGPDPQLVPALPVGLALAILALLVLTSSVDLFRRRSPRS